MILFITSSIALADNSELPSLREIYKDHFHIGTAVSVASWAPKALQIHGDLIGQQYSSLTAENAMKPDYTHPREGVFNFRESNNMIRYAEDHDMVVRGHTLVWHAQTADWFFRTEDGILVYEDVYEGGERVGRNFKDELITDEFRELVQARLENHIESILEYYKGSVVYAWDVVNEAVTDDSNRIHRLDSPWYRILGDDFLKIAFRKAHEVDPNVKLFYNDYNADAPYKIGRIITLLEDMINDGVHIDGMGMQSHWGVNGPSISEIENAFKRYAELGLEIEITELDIGLDGGTEEQQAERYREVFQLFKKYDHVITNVTLWGPSDDLSWRGDDDPLLFNRNHEPKPAFWAIVDTDKPWYVNKAEHVGAAFFSNSAGKEIGSLMSGEYVVNDVATLDFKLEDVASLTVQRGHLVTFYETEDFQGETWHFITTEEFDGAAIANQAKSFTVRHIEATNVVLNQPADANVRPDRAGRAIDGNYISSWSPSEEPPYWLTVDLGEVHLLNRWILHLQGTGPVAGGVAETPLNAADFKLQVSEDGVNWSDADVVEGNTTSITDRDLNLVAARFVRLYVTRPTSLDINRTLVVHEFEVYGVPVE